jgi:hypothetical protein
MNYPVVGTDIKINFTVAVDITGAKTKQVGYIKPGGTTIAYLDATITQATPTGIGYVNLTAALNDTAGIWKVFPWIVQSDDKIVGAPSKEFTVIEKGATGKK